MSSNPWIVCVARNNVSLLQQAVASFEAQRITDADGAAIKPRILVVDNGSHDTTRDWLHSRPEITSIFIYPQHGVAHAWNQALRYLFSLGGQRAVDRVLVCNQDAVLRPDTWYWLAAEGADFVTAIGNDNAGSLLPLMDEGQPISTGIGQIQVHHPTDRYPLPRPEAKRPHPDFSCFMISRDCYEIVGPFDENFAPAWFEDNKYHIEMHRHGILAYSIDLPFWHVGGGAQTLERATEDERKALAAAFARNKARFVEEYGCDPSDIEAYERLFSDKSFGMYARVAPNAKPHQVR